MDRYALLAVTLEGTYVENSIWSCRCASLAITDGVSVPVSHDMCLNTANTVCRGNTINFSSLSFTFIHIDSLHSAGSTSLLQYHSLLLRSQHIKNFSLCDWDWESLEHVSESSGRSREVSWVRFCQTSVSEMHSNLSKKIRFLSGLLNTSMNRYSNVTDMLCSGLSAQNIVNYNCNSSTPMWPVDTLNSKLSYLCNLPSAEWKYWDHHLQQSIVSATLEEKQIM